MYLDLDKKREPQDTIAVTHSTLDAAPGRVISPSGVIQSSFRNKPAYNQHEKT